MTTDNTMTILTSEDVNQRYRYFSTKSTFFNEEVRLKREHNKLIFTHVGLDYMGRTFKFTKKYNVFANKFALDIPAGIYEFSNESNEDQVIININ